MNKPLCYYVHISNYDDHFLIDFQKQYGNCFQKLSKREQLFLISSLAARLCCYEKGEIRSEVFATACSAQVQLTHREMEGLCEALINQVRWGNHNGETATN